MLDIAINRQLSINILEQSSRIVTFTVVAISTGVAPTMAKVEIRPVHQSFDWHAFQKFNTFDGKLFYWNILEPGSKGVALVHVHQKSILLNALTAFSIPTYSADIRYQQGYSVSTAVLCVDRSLATLGPIRQRFSGTWDP